MVKLLGRAKRLNEALRLAEDYRKVLEVFSGFPVGSGGSGSFAKLPVGFYLKGSDFLLS